MFALLKAAADFHLNWKSMVLSKLQATHSVTCSIQLMAMYYQMSQLNKYPSHSFRYSKYVEQKLKATQISDSTASFVL
ncbi:hypothetical protein XENTR_v10014782 [Xenopus tropicalis]|nr:hypothetical protein XENTR_v10014782 [Xenopus tropicalis]